MYIYTYSFIIQICVADTMRSNASLVVAVARELFWRLVPTVPDIQNICNILTIVGHCFGHQSGLDESSGRNSTIFLYGITMHVYLMFQKVTTHNDFWQMITKASLFEKTFVDSQQKMRQA